MKSLVIGIINAKGGVGKTTSAMYLATVLASKGVEVWDADPQGSASEWALRAEENDDAVPFEVISVNRPQIKKRATKQPITFIDSPPLDEATLNSIAERADAVIIPTAPNGADVERLFSTRESLPAGQSAIVLLTDADPRTVLYRELTELLDQEEIAYFDRAIKPRQAIRAAYGSTPSNFEGYEEVAAELIELLEIED